MLFGAKKVPEETALIIDIENGSVAAGLVRIVPGREPKLYGAHRVHLPVLSSVSAAALLKKIGGGVREALEHASSVAARLRGHEQAHSLGQVSRVEIFLGPPWSHFEEPHWHHEESLLEDVSRLVSGHFGYIPSAVHPAGRPLLSVAKGLFPQESEMLLSTVTGEVTELLLLREGKMSGRATIPHGHHLFLRTLQSHGGYTPAEARSALRLAAQAGGAHAPVRETLAHGAQHFLREFKDAARALLDGSSTRTVLIAAPEPVGELFARSLSDESFAELFPQGGVVRALRARHLSPHFATPSQQDLFLMLQALFVDAHSSVQRKSTVL
jgi:hypothetical protein